MGYSVINAKLGNILLAANYGVGVVVERDTGKGWAAGRDEQLQAWQWAEAPAPGTTDQSKVIEALATKYPKPWLTNFPAPWLAFQGSLGTDEVDIVPDPYELGPLGCYDVRAWAKLEAVRTSAAYYNKHLTDKPTHKDMLSNLRAAAAIAPPGLVLEFGVWSGETINVLADVLPDRQIAGFDSFEGLPESWNHEYDKGAFATRGAIPEVAQNVTLVKGWFDATLPGYLAANPIEPIGLVHIDSDIYSSAAYALQQLKPRLLPGTVIVFDEYFNYPGWEQGEYRALQELGLPYEYVSSVPSHQQVTVRLL